MYKKPEMEVIEFLVTNVICTSINGEELTEGNDNPALAPDEW